MGFMELRAGTIGFRLPSLSLFLVSTTQNLRTIKRLASGPRSKKTGKKKKQNKTKNKNRNKNARWDICISIFVKKNGIFLITPTELGPPVVPRCCINFSHEPTWQILTNQRIQIERRAWPAREHEKQLFSLPVIAGWIFASEVSLKSKF